MTKNVFKLDLCVLFYEGCYSHFEIPGLFDPPPQGDGSFKNVQGPEILGPAPEFDHRKVPAY